MLVSFNTIKEQSVLSNLKKQKVQQPFYITLPEKELALYQALSPIYDYSAFREPLRPIQNLLQFKRDFILSNPLKTKNVLDVFYEETYVLLFEASIVTLDYTNSYTKSVDESGNVIYTKSGKNSLQSLIDYCKLKIKQLTPFYHGTLSSIHPSLYRSASDEKSYVKELYNYFSLEATLLPLHYHKYA